jgi:nitric oxide dioxygenase
MALSTGVVRIRDEHRATLSSWARSPSIRAGFIGALPNASIYVWYEQDADSRLPVDGVFPGLMDLSQVTLPDDAVYYLCGPLPFMQAIRNALIERRVRPEDIQYEVFGVDLWQADFD